MNWIDQYMFVSEYELSNETLRQTWIISYGKVVHNVHLLHTLEVEWGNKDQYVVLIHPYSGDVDLPKDISPVDPNTVTPENINSFLPEMPEGITPDEQPVAYFLAQDKKMLREILRFCKYFVARHGYLPPQQTYWGHVIDMHPMGWWIANLYFQQN